MGLKYYDITGVAHLSCRRYYFEVLNTSCTPEVTCNGHSIQTSNVIYRSLKNKDFDPRSYIGKEQFVLVKV